MTAAILKIIFIQILFELRTLKKNNGDHADLDRSRIIFHALPISSFFCFIQEQLITKNASVDSVYSKRDRYEL